MTLESDMLCIVFVESNHSAVNVEWNHIRSLLSSCERMNPIQFHSGTSVSKKAALFLGFLKTVGILFKTQNDSGSQLNKKYAPCDDDELHKINAKEN